MRHLDEERLADLALGGAEPLRFGERAHLRVCRSCAGRAAELRRIVATGTAGPPYPLRPTRPGLLTAIQAELTGDTSAAESDLAPERPVELTDRRPPRADPSRTTPARAVPARAVPDRVPSRAPRRVPRYVPLVAAAAVLAAAVGGTLWYRTTPEDVVVARADLTALPNHSGQGRAELVRRDGSQLLSIDVTGPAPADAFEELWLINTDGQRMISLGVVPADGRGSYPVPASAAGLAGYTIVDISLEPYDGNAAHSRNSVLRGRLG